MKIEYCYWNVETNNIEKITKKECNRLQGVLKKLKRSMLYRGFNKEINSDFWNFVFIVGEKGQYFRKELMDNSYFESMSSLDEQDKEISDKLEQLTNRILPKYLKKYPKIKINIQDLESKIKYLKEKKYTDKYIYIFILNWIHNMGKITELKDESPMISATTSKKTAIEFAAHSSKDVQYLYCLFTNNAKHCKYFSMKSMKKIFNKLEIEWHNDVHNEVIFKDAIFPHNILSIIKVEADKELHIMNPYLLEMLSKINNDELLLVILRGYGIIVDQTDFDDGLEALGYNKYISVDKDTNFFIGNKKYTEIEY